MVSLLDLSRLTCKQDQIGIDKSYSCLSATTIKIFKAATIVYIKVQGEDKYIEQLNTMASNDSNKIDTVFLTTVAALIQRISNQMNNAPRIPEDPEEITPEHTIELSKFVAENTKVMYDLVCALAADVSVKETISQKIVTCAAANSQFKHVTASVVASGIQRPMFSSQQSTASTSTNVSASQSIAASGIKSTSKFNSLKTPPKTPKSEGSYIEVSGSVKESSSLSDTVPIPSTPVFKLPKLTPQTTPSSSSKFGILKKPSISGMPPVIVVSKENDVATTVAQSPLRSSNVTGVTPSSSNIMVPKKSRLSGLPRKQY